MISGIKMIGGYGAKLPNLKGRRFEFNKGLNVLFGPNGSGKTTLLKTMGNYCFCDYNGGWSKQQHAVGKSDYPHGFLNGKPKACKAEVEWDGTATYLHVTADSDSNIAYFGQTDCLDFNEEVSMCVRPPSSGEQRIYKIGKVIKTMKTPPDLTKLPKNRDPKYFKEFVAYIHSLPITGPATLLLDEPDRSLSLENQLQLWTLIPNLASWCQVIVSTHSPFALLNKSSNLIEVQAGYIDKVKKAVQILSLLGHPEVKDADKQPEKTDPEVRPERVGEADA